MSMSIAPIFARVPRYIFAVVSEAILVRFLYEGVNLPDLFSNLIPVATIGAVLRNTRYRSW